MSPAFRHGSTESLDFYAHYDQDLGRTSAPEAKTTPQPARTFAGPGTSATDPQPMADAVIVLMTPDALAYVKGEFYDPARDDPREARETGQARQNVIFEAGWAMGLGQERVILARVSGVRLLSDIDEPNYVWLTNEIDSRRQLITRLRNCELEVHDNHDGCERPARSLTRERKR